MKQHGMLYKAEMVRRIMDAIDPKTQTRRPITFDNSICTPHVRRDEWAELRWGEAWLDESGPSPAGNPGPYWHVPFRDFVVRVYPRIQPGDVIWVKETFRPSERGIEDNPGYEDGIEYRADNAFLVKPASTLKDDFTYRWKPSIFMPRWASRIDLKVLQMRSQRIQDITLGDVKAEGITITDEMREKTQMVGGLAEFHAWKALWDSINTDRGFPWADNHPVWIHDFERAKV